MEYTVIFNNLMTELSVNPAVTFKQGKFLNRTGIAHVNTDNKVAYPDINALQVYCRDEDSDEDGYHQHLQCLLRQALYLAEEILTAVAAYYQVECYFERPIACVYKDETYELRDNFWREVDPNVSTSYGGKFADDLSFLDENKNVHPMFHLYRQAKDDTQSGDYRLLNSWLFLEAYYGLQGESLKKHLKKLGNKSKFVDDFYVSYRCAAAHATALNSDPTTESVMVPRSWETQFDGSIILQMSAILKLIDKLVADYKPKLIDKQR